MKILLAIFLLLPSLSWGQMTDEDFHYKSVYVCGELFNDVNSWDRFDQSAFDVETIQFINFDGKGNVVVEWGFNYYKSWEKTTHPHTFRSNGGVYSLDVKKIGGDTFVMNLTIDSRNFKFGGTSAEFMYYQMIFDRKHKRFEALLFEDDTWSVPIKNFSKVGKCLLQHKVP